MKCFSITDETSTTTFRVRAGKKPSAALRHALAELVNLAKREMDREAASDTRRMIMSIACGICPDCGLGHMLRGPQAALTENVKCDRCAATFNYCPPCVVFPAGFAERVK